MHFYPATTASLATYILTRAEVDALLSVALDDATRPGLHAIAFTDSGRAVATDGHRLTLARAPERAGRDSDTAEVRVVPRPALEDAARAAGAGGWIVVQVGPDGARLGTVTRRHAEPTADTVAAVPTVPVAYPDRPFPPYMQVLPALAAYEGVRGPVAYNAGYLAVLEKISRALAPYVGKRASSLAPTIRVGNDAIPLRADWTTPAGDFWTHVLMPCRSDDAALRGDADTEARCPAPEPVTEAASVAA